MDVSAIVQVISTVGFPIAACVALYFQQQKQNEQNRAELEVLKEALNQNTVALTKLVTIMEIGKGVDVDET